MTNEIIHYSILTLLAGISCKLYDDMNDNNLYEKNDFLKKRKDYINEFLKVLHTGLLIYVSSKYISPIVLFTIMNLVQIVVIKSGFESPYEYSGLIFCILWSIYLLVNNSSYTFNDIKIYLFIFFIICIGQGIADLSLSSDSEYSYKKLAIRSVGTIFSLLVLFLNHFFKLVKDEVIFWLWYLVGYCFTSCIFQILLLRMNSQEQKDDISDSITITPFHDESKKSNSFISPDKVAIINESVVKEQLENIDVTKDDTKDDTKEVGIEKEV